MPAVTRLGDKSTSDPCGAPARPNNKASENVFADGLGVHRKTDSWEEHSCPGSPPHGATTTSGSPTVFVNSLPIARIGDTISCGSTIAEGSSTVFAN
jgi:uncharacterized Zn-binding protein involved in type VI secretion